MLIYLIQQGKLPFTSSNVVVTCFLPSGECFLGSRLSWVGEYLVVSGLGICVTQCFILYLNDGLRPFTPTLVALSSFSHLFLITWWKLGNSRSTSPLLTAWIGLDQILPHLSVAFDKSVRQIFECNFCASSRVWSASMHRICSQLFSSLSFCTFCTSAVVFMMLEMGILWKCFKVAGFNCQIVGGLGGNLPPSCHGIWSVTKCHRVLLLLLLQYK